MIHKKATIESGVEIGNDVFVWAQTTIRRNSRIGDGTSIGIDAYIGVGVKIGSNCKIQNGAYIYEPAQIGDSVFIGPRVIMTNDKNPRAVNQHGNPKNSEDWTPVGVIVGSGASIGAGAICVAPIHIGSWASIAAGSVVTKDVPDFALMMGVPAKRVGWVGFTGFNLLEKGPFWVCPDTGAKFKVKFSPDGREYLTHISDVV